MQTEIGVLCEDKTIYVVVRYWVDGEGEEINGIPQRLHNKPLIFYPSEPGTNNTREDCLSYCPLDGHGAAWLDLINDSDRVRMPNKDELIDAIILATKNSINDNINIAVIASDYPYDDEPFHKIRERRLDDDLYNDFVK